MRKIKLQLESPIIEIEIEIDELTGVNEEVLKEMDGTIISDYMFWDEIIDYDRIKEETIEIIKNY
jgi:hypothetical protein